MTIPSYNYWPIVKTTNVIQHKHHDSQLVLSLSTLNQHDSHSSSTHFLTLPHTSMTDRSRPQTHIMCTHTHTRSISCPGWVIVVALKAVTSSKYRTSWPTPSYPMAGETGLNKARSSYLTRQAQSTRFFGRWLANETQSEEAEENKTLYAVSSETPPTTPPLVLVKPSEKQNATSPTAYTICKRKLAIPYRLDSHHVFFLTKSASSASSCTIMSVFSRQHTSTPTKREKRWLWAQYYCPSAVGCRPSYYCNEHRMCDDIQTMNLKVQVRTTPCKLPRSTTTTRKENDARDSPVRTQSILASHDESVAAGKTKTSCCSEWVHCTKPTKNNGRTCVSSIVLWTVAAYDYRDLKQNPIHSDQPVFMRQARKKPHRPSSTRLAITKHTVRVVTSKQEIDLQSHLSIRKWNTQKQNEQTKRTSTACSHLQSFAMYVLGYLEETPQRVVHCTTPNTKIRAPPLKETQRQLDLWPYCK